MQVKHLVEQLIDHVDNTASFKGCNEYLRYVRLTSEILNRLDLIESDKPVSWSVLGDK